MAIVMVAEYITSWIIDALKLAQDELVSTEPLPQQLWLCVAKKDPINHEKTTKIKDAVGISPGQQNISLKIKHPLGKEYIKTVQLRYLIGCVSVVGNDGKIYQYSVTKHSLGNEITDLEMFGYVYVTAFSSDVKAFQSIVEGRKLDLAKWDKNGDILTRFEDIIEHAQTYLLQNDQHISTTSVTKETAKQVAEVLREQKIFVDRNYVKEELRKAQETIELSVDVLREEIEKKAKYYQISIDAAHEQIKLESAANRETMKKDNEIRYEEASEKLKKKLKEMKTNLEQLIEQRMNDIERQMQENTEKIFTVAETARVQSQQADAEAKHATQVSQQLLKEATQAAIAVQNHTQQAEQERQKFQLVIKSCEDKVREAAATQKEFYERTISEMRTKHEFALERAKEAAHQSAENAKASAQAARQSESNTQDVQKMTENQLKIQKKETEKTIAEAKDTRIQSERAAAEAKEARKQAERTADWVQQHVKQ